MNNISPEQAFEKAQVILGQLFTENEAFQPKVSQAKQEREIKLLNETIKYERFFFVVDLKTRKILHTNGLQKWMGYNDSEFSMLKYFQIMHPKHLESLNMLAQAAFQAAHSGKYKISFMEQKYIVQLPIRHIDGHYLLTKRTLSPFQIDQQGRVTAYLNEFTIIGKHEPSHALEPWLLDSNGNQLTEAATEIRNRADELLDKVKRPRPFSIQHLRILRKIAYQKDISLKQIAQSLQIKPASMETHSRRLLENARAYFENDDFKTLRDVAIYAKREGYV